MIHDLLFKKLVTLSFGGQELKLRVAQELFSSHDIDIGTQRLLRTVLTPEIDACRKILDLGCGYGPIGLALKKANENRVVHMVDRDALALEFSRQNADINHLSDVNIYGSLGYADVLDTDFDLILSNIPAKAGEEAVVHFLRDAVHHLGPGGIVAVVVVSRLEEIVQHALSDGAIDILLKKSWPGHTVFHYRFSAGASYRFSSEASGMPDHRDSDASLAFYRRQDVQLTLRKRTFTMRTAHDLPTINADTYQEGLLIQRLLGLREGPIRHAVFFAPGQGEAPVALWRLQRPAAITLIDRDLLSVRMSRDNLLLNGCPEASITSVHQVGLLLDEGGQADLIIGALRDDEGSELHTVIVEQAAQQLAPGGSLVVTGSSTAIARLEAAIRSAKVLVIGERKRKKGKGLLVLRRA